MRSELVAVRTPDGFVAAFQPGRPLDGDAVGRLATFGELIRSPDDGSPICVVDGELFNRLDLCRDLQLPEGCDDEAVVATAYARWGRAFPEKLRGSFCILVWDGKREGLVVSDQLGLRTAYTHNASGQISIATEIRSLLRVLRRRPGPDAVGLAHWLAGSEMPSERTLFEGISKLPGGSCLDLSAGGLQRYWEPRFRDPPPLSRAEAVEGLWSSLVGAVGRRMVSSGPTALVMSGGVDSSSVAAAAVESVTDDAQVRGYSIVFPGYPHKRVDESARIAALVDGLQLASTRVRIEPVGAFALALDYLSDWDVPATGAGYMVERPLLELAAADGATAVLDGQGGDELYALSGFLIADRALRGRLLSSWRLTQRLPGAAGRSRRQLFDAWRYFAVPGILPRSLYESLHERRHPSGPSWLAPELRRVRQETAVEGAWRDRRDVPRWWAHKSYLLTEARAGVGLPDYLRRRAASAGLVARPPLFDLDLVEFALQIPPELEFAAELDRPLIREAMRGRVPDAVRLDIVKSNLAPFYDEVIRGPDLAPIREVLSASDLEIGAYVDVEDVRTKLENPPEPGAWGSDLWTAEIWRLMTAECWLRAQIDPGYVDEFRDRGDLPRPFRTIETRTGQSALRTA